MKKEKLAQWFLSIALFLLSLLFLVPLEYALLNSFKTEQEIFRVPQSFLPDSLFLENYQNIFAGKFGGFSQYFWNSTVISCVSVVSVVVLASLAGYGFARLPFKGSGFLLALILLTLAVPLAVFLVPIYLMESKLGLLNTNWGLILPNVAVVLPFAIFIMRANFAGIPKELEEAATIDGCGIVQTWWRVMLPMARNGLVIVVIHAFYNIWGEYTLARTLATDPSAMPLTVGLTLFKGETWALGTLSAVIVLSMLPPIIIFLLFQKQLVEGITQGSVKG